MRMQTMRKRAPDTPLDRETKAAAASGGLLYGLTVAFPAWAGALLLVYSVVWGGFALLKIRSR